MMFFFAFQAILSILFFHGKVIFLVILLVGTGEPLPYCNKNTLGKIASKFGIGRPPPPSVGTKDQIFRQIQYEGSPYRYFCDKNTQPIVLPRYILENILILFIFQRHIDGRIASLLTMIEMQSSPDLWRKTFFIGQNAIFQFSSIIKNVGI